MPSILMVTLFYKALLLQGEILSWSPLGLKGFKACLGVSPLRKSWTLFIQISAWEVVAYEGRGRT